MNRLDLEIRSCLIDHRGPICLARKTRGRLWDQSGASIVELSELAFRMLVFWDPRIHGGGGG